eukprot:scaffold84678_cov64-Phaeocystis_antarctica.AAC.1
MSLRHVYGELSCTPPPRQRENDGHLSAGPTTHQFCNRLPATALRLYGFGSIARSAAHGAGGGSASAPSAAARAPPASVRSAASGAVSASAGSTAESTPLSLKSAATAAAAWRPVTTAFSVLHDAWPVRSTQSPQAYSPLPPSRTPGESAADPTAK